MRAGHARRRQGSNHSVVALSSFFACHLCSDRFGLGSLAKSLHTPVLFVADMQFEVSLVFLSFDGYANPSQAGCDFIITAKLSSEIFRCLLLLTSRVRVDWIVTSSK